MKPEELANFDECFLTGTAAELTPVSLVGEYKFTPGAACKALLEAFSEAVTPKKVAAE
jgi:branched-chain amino acid aminotransferase